MTGDTQQGDGYTLGLLVDLRDICRKIGDNHYRMSAELHDLLRKVANPEVHGLDKEMTFRVQQTAHGEYGETLRIISLNGNAEVGRAASFRNGGTAPWPKTYPILPEKFSN